LQDKENSLLDSMKNDSDLLGSENDISTSAGVQRELDDDEMRREMEETDPETVQAMVQARWKISDGQYQKNKEMVDKAEPRARWGKEKADLKVLPSMAVDVSQTMIPTNPQDQSQIQN
jgi:hypothetical protein